MSRHVDGRGPVPRAGFGARVHRAELRGGTFHWLEAGDEEAPVVLCLHGFPDHPRSFEPLLEPLLERGHRVVAPWMRGYHPSVVAPPYTGRRIGQDAVELAERVGGGRKVILLGHDWGAIAAWHAAAMQPSLFAALVALSVPHPAILRRNLRRHPRKLLRGWYVAAFQLPLLPERLLSARDFAVLRHVFEGERGELPPYWGELRETLRESLPSALGYYRALRRRGSVPGRIRVPTLFCTGTDEPAIPPTLAEGQQRVVDAPYESLILKAGHFVHHEHPAEIAAQLGIFLASAVEARPIA